MELFIDLKKGMLNKGKLVKKQVQVRRSNGSVYTRMQWVSTEANNPYKEPVSKGSDTKMEWIRQGSSGHFDEQKSHISNYMSNVKKHISSLVKDKSTPSGEIGGASVHPNVHRTIENAKKLREHVPHLEKHLYNYLRNVAYPADSHEDTMNKMNFLREHAVHSPITINFDPFHKPRKWAREDKNMDSSTVYDGLMSSGKYKPLSAVDKNKSSFHHDARKDLEQNFLGVPKYGGEPPVYGAYNFGKYDNGATHMYGGAHLVLKPHVKDRATSSHEDSLNGWSDLSYHGDPSFPGVSHPYAGDGYQALLHHLADHPSGESKAGLLRSIFDEMPDILNTKHYQPESKFNREVSDYDPYIREYEEGVMPRGTGKPVHDEYQDGTWDVDHEFGRSHYVEAQVHGGVDLSRDVDKIVGSKHFTDDQHAKMEQLAKKHGIPYEKE